MRYDINTTKQTTKTNEKKETTKTKKQTNINKTRPATFQTPLALLIMSLIHNKPFSTAATCFIGVVFIVVVVLVVGIVVALAVVAANVLGSQRFHNMMTFGIYKTNTNHKQNNRRTEINKKRNQHSNKQTNKQTCCPETQSQTRASIRFPLKTASLTSEAELTNKHQTISIRINMLHRRSARQQFAEL